MDSSALKPPRGVNLPSNTCQSSKSGSKAIYFSGFEERGTGMHTLQTGNSYLHTLFRMLSHPPTSRSSPRSSGFEPRTWCPVCRRLRPWDASPVGRSWICVGEEGAGRRRSRASDSIQPHYPCLHRPGPRADSRAAATTCTRDRIFQYAYVDTNT